MDERVKELLDRVRGTAVTMTEAAGTTARCVGQRAGQLVDVAKLNMKIFDLKTDINELLRKIGLVVYGTHLGSDSDPSGLDAMLDELDRKHAAVEELKERIAVLKDLQDCPHCGDSCARSDKFCKACGKEL